MDWIESISAALDYLEAHLTEDLTPEKIAAPAFLSPFYFQKGFSMLCGYTVGEYVRRRRLSQAGIELISSQNKIIDIALKYGYDSPDSFTKAFIRFHGVTPTAVRKEGAKLRAFAPLKIKFSLEGGSIMEYKIVEKEAFTVVGVSRRFDYEHSKTEIPQFWTDYYHTAHPQLCGKYGICLDDTPGGSDFDYLIADDYDPAKELPEGCTTRQLPQNTWAVFPCKGAMPYSLQSVNQKIFSEWLPNCKEYKIAGGYNVELYTDARLYPHGTQDENYYSEIWIPVKKL